MRSSSFWSVRCRLSGAADEQKTLVSAAEALAPLDLGDPIESGDEENFLPASRIEPHYKKAPAAGQQDPPPSDVTRPPRVYAPPAPSPALRDTRRSGIATAGRVIGTGRITGRTLTLSAIAFVAVVTTDLWHVPYEAWPRANSALLGWRDAVQAVLTSGTARQTAVRPLPALRSGALRKQDLFDIAQQSMTALPARLESHGTSAQPVDMPVTAVNARIAAARRPISPAGRLASADFSAVQPVPEPVEVFVPRPHLISGGTLLAVAPMPVPVPVAVAAQPSGSVVVTTGSVMLTSYRGDSPIPPPRLLSHPSLSHVAVSSSRAERPVWASAWREARAAAGTRQAILSVRDMMLVGQ